MNNFFLARYRGSIIRGAFSLALLLPRTTASADYQDIQYKNGVPVTAHGLPTGTLIKDPKTGDEFEVSEGGALIRLTANNSEIETLLEVPAPKKPMPSLRNWRNPVIRLDSYGLHVNGSPNLRLEDLLKTLASIPRSGWPYGRVIELVPYPGLSSVRAGDDTMAKVLTLLKSAGIEVVYMLESA